MDLTGWITFAGFILQAVVYLVVGIWKLSQIKSEILAAIAVHRKEYDDEFARVRREFGEVGQAIREKITQVELFCRDNYVRRDSFYKVNDDTQASIKELGKELRERLERMEEKIDSKT